jgi:RNA polymerase-binding transcription factor DksA
VQIQPEGVPAFPENTQMVEEFETAGTTEIRTAGPNENPDPEAVLDRVDGLLNEVEQALDRLDEGSYGQCPSCGGPISDERLAADPTVRECGDCRPQQAS